MKLNIWVLTVALSFLHSGESFAGNVRTVSMCPDAREARILLANFSKLPNKHQSLLLGRCWGTLPSKPSKSAIRTIVKTTESPGLRALALRRWYELDPTSARTLIISEIQNPNSTFEPQALSILKERELPEVQDYLLAQFRDSLCPYSARSRQQIARYIRQQNKLLFSRGYETPEQ